MPPHISNSRHLKALLILSALLLLLAASWSARFVSTHPQKNASANLPGNTLVPQPAVSNGQLPGPQDKAKPSTLGVPGQVIVGHSIKNDVSPPLHSIRPLPPIQGFAAPENDNPPLPPDDPTKRIKDPVVQDWNGPFAMPTPLLTFEGTGNRNGGYPPDTNGDVGPNHYVQWVNSSFQIWNKAGTSLYGPVNGNTLWFGFGGLCETRNDGDIIALYDPIGDRWLMSQLTSAAPYYQCIAVSTGPDPTGSYYRYAFTFNATALNDYPKFGVWPDAYYMSANLFSGGTSFIGPMAVAYDRASMMAGLPATYQRFTLSTSYFGLLPSDLDGSTLPPQGSTNTFASVYGSNNFIRLWRFHVDWNSPGNSTFTGPTNITTAPFDSNLCGGSTCIPQPDTTSRLSTLTAMTMYRLAYRNMGDHESWVTNHSVDSDGLDHAGVRWYEVRNTGGAPFIYQQGTYAPDAEHRWMGSIAMDHDGNIAVGYNVSSSSVYPSIRYAGRLASDPLGTLAQGEAVLAAGGGSQTTTGGRWGDYSMMSIDPSDDCTFWFTGEYYRTTSTASWNTRVGAFKFPSCGAGPTATAAPTHTSTSTPTDTPTDTPTEVPTQTPTPTPSTTPCSISFTDVLTTDYFYEAVRYLYCHGAVSGYGAVFLPYNLTTRGQLTKIVVLAEGWTIYTPPNPTFVDVPTDNAFYQYIETAYQQGIISGYSCGTGCLEFRPGANVTRAQLCKIIVLAEGWAPYTPPVPTYQDVPSNDPFYEYIETSYSHSIISGYSCGGGCLEFRPHNNATRGQICKIVHNAVLAP